MGSYPGAKVHRVSRRKLGRGQHVQLVAVRATITANTVTTNCVFDRPAVVSGIIDLHVGSGIALVSQLQVDATHVTQVYLSSVVGKTWSVDGSAPVRSFQGGLLAPASGTF